MLLLSVLSPHSCQKIENIQPIRYINHNHYSRNKRIDHFRRGFGRSESIKKKMGEEFREDEEGEL